jgi:hypothetical protein
VSPSAVTTPLPSPLAVGCARASATSSSTQHRNSSGTCHVRGCIARRARGRARGGAAGRATHAEPPTRGRSARPLRRGSRGGGKACGARGAQRQRLSCSAPSVRRPGRPPAASARGAGTDACGVIVVNGNGVLGAARPAKAQPGGIAGGRRTAGGVTSARACCWPWRAPSCWCGVALAAAPAHGIGPQQQRPTRAARACAVRIPQGRAASAAPARRCFPRESWRGTAPGVYRCRARGDDARGAARCSCPPRTADSSRRRP